jgi:hypothetical protein
MKKNETEPKKDLFKCSKKKIINKIVKKKKKITKIQQKKIN